MVFTHFWTESLISKYNGLYTFLGRNNTTILIAYKFRTVDSNFDIRKNGVS